MLRRGTFPGELGAIVLSVAALMSVAVLSGADHLLQAVGASGRIPVSGLVFNTGHQSAVTHLEPWRGGSSLVSAGVDGTLRVWDPRDGTLRHSVALGGIPSRLVVHPWLPRVYVALNSVSGGRLFAWDWERERELFSISQSAPPLFLGLSRTAGSLLVGRESFDGLWILDATTGATQAGSEHRTGIVTFAVTSRDEQIVLTYQPSGTLTYRDRATRQVNLLLRAPAELTDSGLSRDRRYLIGRVGDWLVSVDAVNGTEMDRRRVDGLRLMELWEITDRVLVVAEDELGPALHLLRFVDGRFAETDLRWQMTGTPAALAYGRDEIFVGMADGTILKLDLQEPEQGFFVLVRDERLAIIDVAVVGDTITLGTEAGAVTVTGDFIGGEPLWLTEGRQVDVRTHVFPRPFGPGTDRAVRVTALDSERVLVWSAEEPGIMVLNLLEDRLGGLQLPLAAPLFNLDITRGIIAAVDRGGNAALLAIHAGEAEDSYDSGSDFAMANMLETIFTAKLSGAADVVAGKRDGAPALIAALSSFGVMGSSIVSIATSTGETVALPDPRGFVYELSYDPHAEELFSLIVHGGIGRSTTLHRHSGRWLDQRRALFVASGEDLYASVVLEETGERVFFSLAGRVRLWDGQGIRTLEDTGREARQLAVHRGRVYGVNVDGTLSVWSADTLRHKIDLHIWRNFEWLVTSPDRYWTSEEGARFIRGDAGSGRRSIELRRGFPVLE